MFDIETKVSTKTAYYLPTSTPPLIDLLILSAILVSRYFFSSATLPQTTTGLGHCKERRTEYLLAATRCQILKSYHLVQSWWSYARSDHHQHWAIWIQVHQAMWSEERIRELMSSARLREVNWDKQTPAERWLQVKVKSFRGKSTDNNRVDWEVKVLI